jgi:hypothetical protein
VGVSVMDGAGVVSSWFAVTTIVRPTAAMLNVARHISPRQAKIKARGISRFLGSSRMPVCTRFICGVSYSSVS